MADYRTQADVQRSFGRCTHSPGFFDDFYDAFTQSTLKSRDRFGHLGFKRQKELLKSGLSSMIMLAARRRHSGQRVDALRKRLGSGPADIPFLRYDNWKVALLDTIKRHDKKINWELLEEWDDVLQSGIERIDRPSVCA